MLRRWQGPLQFAADQGRNQERRHGIYALIGYTYARAYDNGVHRRPGHASRSDVLPAAGWQKLDWGLSQINLNHDFTASIIYELPFGKGKRFGSSWNRAAEYDPGGLGAHGDRKSHLRISGVRGG